MNHIKTKQWICGNNYKKRILLENLKEKINLIEDIIIEPKSIIPQHKHNVTDEIFYIMGNSAVMIVENKEFKVNPGDVIYIEKNEEHGFRNESSKEFKMIVLKMNYIKGDSYLGDAQ